VASKGSSVEDVWNWHKCEVPTVSGNVRDGCESGPDADMAGQPPLTKANIPSAGRKKSSAGIRPCFHSVRSSIIAKCPSELKHLPPLRLGNRRVVANEL